ncbi:ABC transporter permease [Nocardia bovistercoris]|uniref:ABC transporter permease n=1 Tax=Nocardia bovistercoris TaxID=2785916 RepID=A0A931N3Y9_9NOCA|nr:ABC transporter permease [Nocardia bovistercoris]
MSDTGSAPRGVWRVVAEREVAVKLRDRNFLISTLVTIIAIVASLLLSGLLTGRAETVTLATAGADADQVVAVANRLAEAADEKVTFTARAAADTAEVQRWVREEKVDVGLVSAPSGWRLIGKDSENTHAETYLGAAAGQVTIERNAAAAGVSLEQLGRGGGVTYDVLEHNSVDAGLARVVAFVFALLFYLSSILFGLSIAQSVVEEKQNRIVEILASAIPLRQLLIGKIAGNTAMALAQLVLFVGAGLLGLAATGRGDQVARIGGAGGWFIVFFVVGFLALAALWAVAGSLATRSEDLQATTTPLSIIVMLVLFAGIFLTGTGRVVASYVPVVSIVAMPSRLAEGSAAWWEPLVALALMAAAAYGIVLVGEKIYRRSLMQTGGRLTIRQALAVQD